MFVNYYTELLKILGTMRTRWNSEHAIVPTSLKHTQPSRYTIHAPPVTREKPCLSKAYMMCVKSQKSALKKPLVRLGGGMYICKRKTKEHEKIFLWEQVISVAVRALITAFALFM